MSTQLNTANLSTFPASIQTPKYDRTHLTQPIIVHIGVGGFHRAHQAVYLDDLLGQGLTDWSLCGVCLLPHDKRMYDTMKSQDCLYTVVEQSSAGNNARIIGSITNILFAPENPQAVIEKIASPECRIVSLTITEGGYYVNSGTGEFDANHPDIQHDLANPDMPKCAFGFLAAALELRRKNRMIPFTLMSCDNMQSNGDVFKKMFLAFARLRNPELAQWLAEHASFPNSMVDRITPATTDEHRAMVKTSFGIGDGWPVVTEPFKQWVIEDHFCNGRPAWEKVGAQMTQEVLPYEKMKIRLLNASHQALCYIGMLVGHQFAHETMEDRRIRTIVERMMDDEATPTLSPVPGVDLTEYKKTLIERFANPAIRDQLARIGTEGSARIPKFVLPIVVDQLARQKKMTMCAFTIAAWFRYLTGVDDNGKKMPIIEPMEAKVCPLAKQGGADPKPMLSLHELFGELPKSEIFVAEVSRALRSFYEKGAVATLEEYSKI
ncbi:mannitol dehydrogenase domain protein [Candidatus Moduliflexus flocculans]|uniref:Mannitol dehydrogenase domain protein n=1 Tax=Candidatus Moduliflexus flocculans TaxID=1499966 RepID=A0A0S6VTY9_9BACT|nr:mannitol dehydrogenase domain protein [Candidatus Moduliflexus flocculans]